MFIVPINLEWDSSARAQRRAENMALVCCAGPAAQRRFNPRGFRKYRAEDDWHQAINLLSYRESDNKILGLYFDMINLQARRFVAQPFNWQLIEGLAEALLDRKRLTGKEVRAAILATDKAIIGRAVDLVQKPK